MATKQVERVESLTLSMRQAMDRLGLSRTTIEKLVVTDPGFPRPRKVLGKILFDRREIEAWWVKQGDMGAD